jgi:hypothetical protein
MRCIRLGAATKQSRLSRVKAGTDRFANVLKANPDEGACSPVWIASSLRSLAMTAKQFQRDTKRALSPRRARLRLPPRRRRALAKVLQETATEMALVGIAALR